MPRYAREKRKRAITESITQSDNEESANNVDENPSLTLSNIPVDLSLIFTDNRIQTFESPFIWNHRFKNLVFLHNQNNSIGLKGLRDILKTAFYDDFSMAEIKQNALNYKMAAKLLGFSTPDQLLKQYKLNAVIEHKQENVPRGLSGGREGTPVPCNPGRDATKY